MQNKSIFIVVAIVSFFLFYGKNNYIVLLKIQLSKYRLNFIEIVLSQLQRLNHIFLYKL